MGRHRDDHLAGLPGLQTRRTAAHPGEKQKTCVTAGRPAGWISGAESGRLCHSEAALAAAAYTAQVAEAGHEGGANRASAAVAAGVLPIPPDD